MNIGLARRHGSGYYSAQAHRLLRSFDRAARYFRKALSSHHLDQSPDRTIQEARQAFQDLIPQIPYIGGRKNSLTRILIGCTMTLALYRVLKRQGMNVEEISQIVVEIEAHRVRAYPSFVLRLLGKYLHLPIGKRRIKKMMVDDSRRHPYPEGWVATFVEGDGIAFDFGIDYTECALCKFYHRQEADDLTRYVCLIDFVQQRAMDAGFFRTTTLAEGGPRCDFRWKRGRETRAAWSPPWVAGTS
jgi:hypothetical protein